MEKVNKMDKMNRFLRITIMLNKITKMSLKMSLNLQKTQKDKMCRWHKMIQMDIINKIIRITRTNKLVIKMGKMVRMDYMGKMGKLDKMVNTGKMGKLDRMVKMVKMGKMGNMVRMFNLQMNLKIFPNLKGFPPDKMVKQVFLGKMIKMVKMVKITKIDLLMRTRISLNLKEFKMEQIKIEKIDL